jgi:hypothetical protein
MLETPETIKEAVTAGEYSANTARGKLDEYRRRTRDEFAMAALSGLLAHSGWAPDDAALCAYRHADAMMRERERRE